MEVVMLLMESSIIFPSETKDASIKELNMIARINEAKTLVKHILCDFVNSSSIVQHAIKSKKDWLVFLIW